MKPTKFSIAVVLLNPENSSEFLAVKRPSDDDNLPNAWGLPAFTVKNGELPEEAVRRLGIEKLATNIEAVSFIGIDSVEKDEYNLILMDILAKLKGEQPSVNRAVTSGTKYIDQQWTSNYDILKEAASKGSLCSKIFLKSKGLTW